MGSGIDWGFYIVLVTLIAVSSTVIAAACYVVKILVELMGVGLYETLATILTLAFSLALWNFSEGYKAGAEKTSYASKYASKRESCAVYGLGTQYQKRYYQYSPTGEKTIKTVGDPVGRLISLTEEERKDPKTSWLRRMTIRIMHITYGGDGKKIVESYTTEYSAAPNVVEIPDISLVERPMSSDTLVTQIGEITTIGGICKYRGKMRDFDHNDVSWVRDESEHARLRKRSEQYNKKVPSVVFEREDEFASGHRNLMRYSLKSRFT